MIVPMARTFVAAAARDRERLLDALGRAGVLHLSPVDPARAAADPRTLGALHAIDSALQLLDGVAPAGEPPALAPGEAAAEVAAIVREAAEGKLRLAALEREAAQIEPWGDVRLAQLEALAAAGVEFRLATLPAAGVERIRAGCVATLATLARGRCLVAVASGRDEPLALPESAELLARPARDRPALRGEARELETRLAAGSARLAALAGLRGRLRRARGELQAAAGRAVALGGGVEHGALFAVQGWVPAREAAGLERALDRAGVPAAVRVAAAGPADAPPTLLAPPRWARPVLGLFRVLGLEPGYREIDVAAAFMIALPIFSAMLISDGGYSLLFALLPAVFYRRLVAQAGVELTRLLIVIGCLGVAWGIVTGSFFGVDLWRELFGRRPLVAVSLDDEARNLLMLVSFVIGTVHLTVARIWRALALFPHPSCVAHVGWGIFLWGMFGVVRYFVLGSGVGPDTPFPYLLGAGALLAIVFAEPSPNPLKMLALGLASFPLSMLGSFSDIMSYVRLMAIGLAGSALAVQFNALAVAAGPLLVVPILVFGHGLNVGLCLIALFAHGVRLNVLEFSSNIGMEWTGYGYRPYAIVRQAE